MSKNLSHLSGRQGLDNNLFEAYAKAAEAQGSPSLEDLEKLKDEFLVGKSSVYGAVSFYDFLRPENRGKKVYVCNGSACLTAGTQQKLKDQLLTHYPEDEIGEMCCLGRCHENNAFHTGQVNYSGTDVENLLSIKNDKNPSAETYHVGFSGTSLLTAPTGDLAIYYKTFARVLEKGEILSEIKTSALRGRGGAGFPIAFKLEACANQTADTKFIVCNADEGDPGAYSDRYIMEQRPHALIQGMLIAGFAAKARYGVVYIRAEYPDSVTIVQNAIDEARGLGWIGENIMGSGFSFDFKVIKAQGAYICGEETALLSSIEGQRPEVRTRPPYPVQQGLFNQPTVVNNVETLACLPWIAQRGGAAYAAIGTEKTKGTKLVSLDGHFNRPGIYEVDMGTPLATVVNELGQGFRHSIKAMHIGGPLGGLVPVHKINELTVDFESFAANGFLLGHASVVCIPDYFPMIEYIEHLFRFTAHESCGKCFPCRLGSTRGYEMIDQSRNTAYKMDRALLDDLLETMEVGSLCALGGGLPLPIKNALQYFEEELKPYFKA
ncbi:MAG: NAD(P)H-dependent oxidoreductase subunit E [Saprospiraceae bacterium]|jgi:NADH:ubiquinone oxidoreductase subunit F (NADH-binding)/NADH:ubiquinone oxidoreductase subunit E|nr:NAD(P)H-dependent oxidoreductase subunit E [Saprospiraceae bacterium]